MPVDADGGASGIAGGGGRSGLAAWWRTVASFDTGASASARLPSGWNAGGGGPGFRVGRPRAGPSARCGGPACHASSWLGGAGDSGPGCRHAPLSGESGCGARGARGSGCGARSSGSRCGTSGPRVADSGARPTWFGCCSAAGCSSFLSRRQPLRRFSGRALAASERSPSAAARFLNRPRLRLGPSSISSSGGRFCTGAS